MANWRRARHASTVHITPDAAPALCGLDRDELGVTIWDAATARASMCSACSDKLLKSADDAIARTSALLAARSRVAGADYENAHELARKAMRELPRRVPPGVHADRLIYAGACPARNDPKDAETSLRLWRNEMRALRVLTEVD